MSIPVQPKIKLNLGSGKNPLPDFVNLDKKTGWQFQDGLTQYADGSVDAITSSHVLMYLDLLEIESGVKEIHRVLKAGGVLRITEDDTENPLSDTYLTGYKHERRCLTGPKMMRRILEDAGFSVYDTDEISTHFEDGSLMQNFHGGIPRCFFMEGVKSVSSALKTDKVTGPDKINLSEINPPIISRGRDPIKWGTHLPLLVRMFDKTEGDVLEMGMGLFSTPILKLLCEMSKRTLYSFESKPEWYKQVAVQETKSFHKVIYCSNWAEADIERHWGLVFVDHSPGRERHVDIKRLANHADIIVIHDTEPQSEKFFRYRSKTFPLFKYRLDFSKYIPWTSAVSNFIDVSKLG